MSTDRRELIAARLLTLAAGIVGATRAVRNATNVSGKSSPAIVVWDGDEAPVTTRGGTDPQTIELMPEIRILAEDAAADIGATLNGLRRQMIYAVQADTTLAGYAGAGAGPGRGGKGMVSYQGCQHALEAGRKIEGELSLTFVIRYELIHDELA